MIYSDWLFIAPVLGMIAELVTVAVGTYIAARNIRHVFKDVIDKYLGK